MTRRISHPLTPRHLAGLDALDKSANGTLYDGQLRRAIGHHASNVILSLQMRGLIRWHGSMFSDLDSDNVHLGAGDSDGHWSLSERGAAEQRKRAPKPAPCCPTCGHELPVVAP